MNDNFKKSWTDNQLIDIAYKKPDDFKPGTDWSYTNTAYLLLGKIIEQVTGETVQAALTSDLFKPLGMNHTFYEENVYSPEIFEQVARGYYNL